MQHKLIGILSLLFASFLFAVPASAANLPQCAPGAFPTETSQFVLVADDNIIFEPQQLQNPARIIQGNVLVTSPHPAGGSFSNTGVGFVKVGANTNVRGTVIADVIILPDGGAKLQACIANTIMGSAVALSKGSCENLPTPTPAAPPAALTFNAFAAAHPTCVDQPLGTLPAFSSLCGPTPTVAACAEAAPPITVDVGGSLTLSSPPDPTCNGALVLKKGSVLTFGTPGPWTFKSVQMDAGSKMIGPATVNVNGKFNTEGGIAIKNIDLNIAQSTPNEVANIFNNSSLDHVNINAPFGKCHLHTGTDVLCSEACCKVLDVEPITAECPPGNDVCVCPAGFKFEIPPQVNVFDQSPGTPNKDRNCVPCGAGDHPPAFPSCP